MLMNSPGMERLCPPTPLTITLSLNLESTVQELSLYEACLDASEPSSQAAYLFAENPLLPGILLLKDQQFHGMISRRRFLEYLSRPYGRELFLRRSLKSLYRFIEHQSYVISHQTLIVEAANLSLQRPPELLYEPLVVEHDHQIYKVLDVHQLLIAQSSIHQLATQLLQQQTQNQLIQTEKMASLGQMVAGVAHEIRNPISSIVGNVGCLCNYWQDILELLNAYEDVIDQSNPEVAEIKAAADFDFLLQDLPEILKSMQAGASRLSQLVQGLHNFSHLDGAQKREADIHECLESTLLILKNRLKYHVEVIKDYGNLPLVPCYSGQLSQVFMNIISNALDALEEPNDPDLISSSPLIEASSLLSLNVTQLTTPTILIRTSVQEAWVSVKIADNGPGMSPEVQKRVFETFFTTKVVGKGTGLGLAISHQIVTEKHGGQIKLFSQEGAGTEFEILLPLA